MVISPRQRRRPIVSLRLEDRMFAHARADGIFQVGGFEERRPIRDSSKRLVRFKDAPGHPDVDVLASLEVEAQPAKHDGDQTTGAGTRDEVEVVAWLGDLVASRSFAFALDICPVHDLLDDN